MSKITINAVLTVLRLVISLTTKIVRLIYSIIDLVDDGCINASAPRPEWMSVLCSAINTIESVGAHLISVEDDIYKGSVNGESK